MEKFSFDLNVRKESSDSGKGAQYGSNPKSVSLVIHNGGCLHQHVAELVKYVKDNKIIFSPASSDKGLIVDWINDLFDDLDEIICDYANTRNEINRKEIIIHVGNSSIVENVVDFDMLFETEGVRPMGNFKEVDVDTDNETEEESVESDTEKMIQVVVIRRIWIIIQSMMKRLMMMSIYLKMFL
nr:hypothetical protein [Tanacetum cinerariifolium]